MIFNIKLETKTGEAYSIAEKVHESLVGNQDYIDSNIVLNFNVTKVSQEVTLFMSADDCDDIEVVRERTKEAIDIFVNSFYERSGDIDIEMDKISPSTELEQVIMDFLGSDAIFEEEPNADK